MPTLNDIRDNIKDQRLLKEVMPVYDTVRSLNEVVDIVADPKTMDPIALQLCVLSAVPFHKGWHCTRIDGILQRSFAEAKASIDELKPARKAKYIFRLTIWQSKKRQRNDPGLKPGSILFTDNVTQLKYYRDVSQGETSIDSVIKTEEEDRGRKQQKTGKKGENNEEEKTDSE